MSTSNPVVEEWIKIAEHDLGGAFVLAEVPYYAPASVLCQQSVEKILKAYIIANGGFLKKTHDLNELVRMCEKYSHDFDVLKKTCSNITIYSTMRYPPIETVTAQNMEQLLVDTRNAFDFTKSKLKDLGYEMSESLTNATMEEVKEAIRVLRRQKSGAVGRG
jgi:HEPN domain-containing protein